ncbi:hypothetical protein NliqN6_0045 [Naganishia liquefaciens]|uniref:FYVE-type domain-containing protein n=1 Tax=Naganishia liquefaciens TaxID=104408 RepID=A0A8H3TMT4_9TREE|nr:hypothetical protein NliqN6_0045 [Naganishia liquefaciens]
MAPQTTVSPASSSDLSSATRSIDKDREHRARLQAYYVTQEPFQIAYIQEQQKREREAMEQEMAMREAMERAHAEEQIQKETTITLDGQQQINAALQQVPPPFILPDTASHEQPSAPVISNNALPVIVSSSAESNDDPQVVNAPDASDHPISEQSSSNDSKPTSSLSTHSEQSGDNALATDGSSGSGEKPRGLLSNLVPAAAALARPLGMQRSLSEFFGLKTQGADENRTPLAQNERRVSHSSTNSDASSLVEEGKSGIIYYQKRGSTDTTASGWSHGERRNRLPAGASGVAVHKDLWKLDQMSETCDFPECNVVFSFTKRRHHCRACGQIFCTPHASFALDLWYPPTNSGEEPRSGAASRRPSNDTTHDAHPNESAPDASVNSLLRPLPTSRLFAQKGAIKPARVCEDCYDKVWNPDRYASRERNRRAEPRTNNDHGDLDNDSQASHSGISLPDGRPASAAQLLNERVLQRSRSARSTGRRMFSAPVSPVSTSPPVASGLEPTVLGMQSGLSRQGSRSSSLAPQAARQNARLARNASAHGALSLRTRMPTSPALASEATPRPMFSPTAEALNVGPQQRSLSPSGLAHTSGNGYFPAMPPPSKAFLPGEEPNQHVNGILSNYPLAYKPTTPGSGATSPYTSGPPSTVDHSGFARAARSSAHMRLDMPKNGFPLDDPMSSKASSARLLTPDREWVPGAWGYAKETFDPDVESESDTEDEDERDDAVEGLVRKTRSRLIVDGDIRLKAHDVVREPKSRLGAQRSPAPQSPATRSMPWSTF